MIGAILSEMDGGGDSLEYGLGERERERKYVP